MCLFLLGFCRVCNVYFSEVNWVQLQRRRGELRLQQSRLTFSQIVVGMKKITAKKIKQKWKEIVEHKCLVLTIIKMMLVLNETKWIFLTIKFDIYVKQITSLSTSFTTNEYLLYFLTRRWRKMSNLRNVIYEFHVLLWDMRYGSFFFMCKQQTSSHSLDIHSPMFINFLSLAELAPDWFIEH